MKVIVPAPFVPAWLAVTDPPCDAVSCTMSLVSELAGRFTELEMLPALAALMYALPAPPPFASTIPLGAPGAVASAVAFTVGLSRLVRIGVPLDTAFTL